MTTAPLNTGHVAPLRSTRALPFRSRGGFCDLDRHLARLKTSAAALDFVFDRHDAINELQAACFRRHQPVRVRLRLSKRGALAIATTAPPTAPVGATATVVPLPVDPEDWRLRHKTSDRAFYDRARAEAGTFEVLFVRADGRLTEGSFTNLFVEDPDGRLRTPSLERGVLPGILRSRLLEEGRAIEADLRPSDLTRGFLVGNSLRGLIPARLA